MDLSLIIPCHNMGAYVGKLCETLKQQDTSKYNVEYVFVLDSCNDDTESVIKSYGLCNCSIMTCSVHRAGLARNIGLEQATGDYIWFVDGDDWLLGDGQCYNIILDTIKDYHGNKVQIAFDSNYYHEKNWRMAWQYIFSREFLWGLRFSNLKKDDDAVFMQDVFRKEEQNPQLPHTRYISTPLYYYNYNRPGAVTTLVKEGRL